MPRVLKHAREKVKAATLKPPKHSETREKFSLTDFHRENFHSEFCNNEFYIRR